MCILEIIVRVGPVLVLECLLRIRHLCLDSWKEVCGSAVAAAHAMELAHVRMAAYPDFLGGAKLRRESFVNSAGLREYARIGVRCPLSCDAHFQRGHECMRWRNTGEKQLLGLGDVGPIAYLGCWLERAADFPNRRHHMKYTPTQTEMAAYVLAHHL
jgi:hypothetical protein